MEFTPYTWLYGILLFGLPLAALVSYAEGCEGNEWHDGVLILSVVIALAWPAVLLFACVLACFAAVVLTGAVALKVLDCTVGKLLRWANGKGLAAQKSGVHQ